MVYEGIPVLVEKEINSLGDETGKFVFVANDLHHYYCPDFDADRMEYHLEQAGYKHREFRPMLREMERQFEALAEPHEQDDSPQAKEKGKPKGKSDEAPPAADPPAAE